MKKLYAPWRYEYVKRNKEGDGSVPPRQLRNNCVFCDQFDQDKDAQYLILKRFAWCAIVMNYYPYNAGHLMVLPFEHCADLSDLDKQTRAEMMEAVSLSVYVAKKVLICDGFNVGINLGKAGGGGIPSHIHIHVIPRWEGDTNFMATIGQTKVICSDLHAVYGDLKKAFDAH